MSPMCNHTSLQPSLEEILTYNDCCDDRDIIINYALILQTVIANKQEAKIMIISTLYLWAFQIVLCFDVGCVGVSVVWSAQRGILIHYRNCGPSINATPTASTTPFSDWAYFAALSSSSVVWIYYAVMEEPITTIAHICATAMSLLMDHLVQRLEISLMQPTCPASQEPETSS